MNSFRLFFLAAVFVFLVSCVFALFPLDLMVSTFCYKLHLFHHHGLYQAMLDVRQSYYLIVVIWVCWLFVALQKKDFFLCYRLLFVALCFLVGSIVVAPFIKEWIGRPRPFSLLIFGGSHQYYAPWVVSQACFHNCSFVSGEAAFSIQVLLFAWLLHDTHHRIWAWVLGVCYFSSVSMLRIMLGRHFLSDVLLAAGIMLMLDSLLYGLMFKEGRPRMAWFSSHPSYSIGNE